MALMVLGVIGVMLLLKQLGQVSRAAALKHLKSGARVIDVRSTREFQAGHLADAINVPLDEIRSRIESLVPDKQQVLLLHCLSGTRSGLARRILKHMGYTQVFNLGSYARAERIVRESR